MKTNELIELAKQARLAAVAPYSNFKVGAVVLTKSGKVYTGCNIENTSYGLTMCAERVALFKALSEGEREFLQIVIVGDTKRETYPCGACRQIMSEFAPHAEVICANVGGKAQSYRMSDLLPHAFNHGDIT